MSKRTNLKMVSFKLSQRGRGALKRIARKQGWTKTTAMERAIVNLEITLQREPVQV